MATNDLQSKISSLLKSSLEHFLVQDYTRAINDLKAAQVLDKENPEVLYNLGICHCRSGLVGTAIPYFQKILSMRAGFVDMLNVKKILSFCFIQKNELESAGKLLDEILKATPADSSALHMKGFLMEKQKDYHGAIKTYRLILENDMHYNTCNSIAYLIARTKGDLSIAMEYAEKALKADENNPAYLDTMGFIYLKMGNTSRAEEYLSHARELLPFSDEIKEHMDMLNKTKNKRK